MDIREQLEVLGVSFGKREIAKNLNYYRRAIPPEGFWEFYKIYKEEMKAEGFSVYKLDGKFYVYDWTEQGKANRLDYENQELGKLDKLKKAAQEVFADYMDSYFAFDGCESRDELEAYVRSHTDNFDEIMGLILEKSKINEIEFDF